MPFFWSPLSPPCPSPAGSSSRTDRQRSASPSRGALCTGPRRAPAPSACPRPRGSRRPRLGGLLRRLETHQDEHEHDRGDSRPWGCLPGPSATRACTTRRPRSTSLSGSRPARRSAAAPPAAPPRAAAPRRPPAAPAARPSSPLPKPSSWLPVPCSIWQLLQQATRPPKSSAPPGSAARPGCRRLASSRPSSDCPAPSSPRRRSAPAPRPRARRPRARSSPRAKSAPPTRPRLATRGPRRLPA
mmetsp:Transcript_52538/g.170702  ORF Transcript_52538/g.170702 Transcript_52538/m.170702 type:complete len:243 (+) Transcript_52538:581-1309(+)